MCSPDTTLQSILTKCIIPQKSFYLKIQTFKEKVAYPNNHGTSWILTDYHSLTQKFYARFGFPLPSVILVL